MGTMVKLKDIIKEMTIEEKTSLISGEDFWRTRAIGRLNIPQMELADGPHGLRKQGNDGDHLGLVKGVDATCFPTSATVANSWDVALGEEIGKALGKEAAFHNVNVILGPGLNIKRNPLCGRNFEYFSEDPYLSGKMAASYVKGIQSNGISACLKHFAANNQEHLRMTSDSIVDERTLNEIYLTGFEIGVKEGKTKVVMSSYNKLNGSYANENKSLLRDTLVNEWGFEGIVVSDWGGSNNTVEGVKAGAHLEMPSTGKDSGNNLVKAIREGNLDESILDERILEYLKVLFDIQIKDKHNVDYEKHHILAQKAAEQSVVLIKNESVLPLKQKTRVAIIGDFAKTPRYQGAGSSMVSPYKLERTLDVIRQTNLDVIGYAQGYVRNGKFNDKKIAEAVELAQKVEIAILYIGLNEVDEVEGNDRPHMGLSKKHITLLEEVSKVANKTVVVLSGGSAIEMPWETNCDAIVHGYLSGQGGASAMLNVLTGKVNPSGKLNETYPMKYEDCPSSKYYHEGEKTSEYREGLYVGYRYYDKANVNVRYPFGYGLSYTTFEYGDLTIEKNRVLCSITNTGDVAGSEIVQLYVGKEQNNIHRAPKELKGFCKVFLKPKQSEMISIPFDEYTFRYYDVNDSQFNVEKGIYHILVASSSRDIRLSGTIDVDGILSKGEDKTSLKKYFDGEVTDISLAEFKSLYENDIPNSKWNRKKILEINDSLSQMVYAKSWLARLGIKILIGLRNRSFKKGKPDLNLLFLFNMPFMAIAKMSDGNISIDMVKEILVIVNGHFFKGIVGFAKSYFLYKKRR